MKGIQEEKIRSVLHQMGISDVRALSQFQNEEDQDYYNVWRVDTPAQSFVLKRAKGYEIETYRSFFTQESEYAPRMFGAAEMDGEDYLLLEFVQGRNMMRCSREDLTRALDAMIAMQKVHWNDSAQASVGQSFERSMQGRQNRRNYLLDPRLEAAYDAYLAEYTRIPRTLCHDDLLPFNVICSDSRAVFIDWEYGGILPYPTSIARLIAHSQEDVDTFFYMKDADKHEAVERYYHELVSHHGISYDDFCRSLDLFLFYEYCEWVYVGNKYGETDTDRFRQYHKLATEMAAKLGF